MFKHEKKYPQGKQYEFICSALRYLDRSGNLKVIRNLCEKYNSAMEQFVYTFKIFIRPGDLLELNAPLGNLVLQSPAEATQIFQTIVHECMETFNPNHRRVSATQISLNLRLSSLPSFPFVNYIERVQDLSRAASHGGFVHLRGIVIGITALSKYTQSARYYCPMKMCEGHSGNHFSRVHIPGASEAQTIRNDFICSFCFAILKEDKSSRILSDRLLIEIVPEKALRNSRSSDHWREQAIPVYIRDDLTKLVSLGEVIHVIGLTRKDFQEEKILITVEANNIKKVECTLPSKGLNDCFSKNLIKLYSSRHGSPWSFVLTLAYIFGGGVSPPGTYFRLKLALLLSLVSGLDEQHTPLHVLAVGHETSIMSRLLNYALMFTDRRITISSRNTLSGRVTTDKYKSSAYFIEGGLLHLSNGGVCNFEDVARLKRSAKERLQSELVNGKMSTDVGSKFTGGMPQQREQPLGCKVWAYMDTTSPKKPQHLEDFLMGICDTGDVSKGFLDAFSLVCFTDNGDSSTNEEAEMQIVQHILNLAILDPPESDLELPLSAEDFHLLLSYAKRLQPNMTKEAASLIKGYYVTIRKSRSEFSSSSVPVSAQQVILSMAYSHAKLSLRSTVLMEDALMAIRLYEEILSGRSVTMNYLQLRLNGLVILLAQTGIMAKNQLPSLGNQRVVISSLSSLQKLRAVAKHNLSAQIQAVTTRKLSPQEGISVLNVQPMPHVTSVTVDHYLGPGNDKEMRHLHSTLLHFCKSSSEE